MAISFYCVTSRVRLEILSWLMETNKSLEEFLVHLDHMEAQYVGQGPHGQQVGQIMSTPYLNGYGKKMYHSLLLQWTIIHQVLILHISLDIDFQREWEFWDLKG